jgi:hypothetical protein
MGKNFKAADFVNLFNSIEQLEKFLFDLKEEGFWNEYLTLEFTIPQKNYFDKNVLNNTYEYNTESNTISKNLLITKYLGSAIEKEKFENLLLEHSNQKVKLTNILYQRCSILIEYTNDKSTWKLNDLAERYHKSKENISKIYSEYRKKYKSLQIGDTSY